MLRILLVSLLLCPFALAAQSDLNDLDNDGCVGASDILIILGQYGECVDTIAPILHYDLAVNILCTEWSCDVDQLIALGALEVIETSPYTIDLQCEPMSGPCVQPIPAYLVSFQAVDESGNASVPGFFYVNLMDDEDPQLTVTCPPAAETMMDDESCDYNSDPSFLGMPTAIAVDECDVNPLLEMTYVDNIVEATCGNGFVVEREWAVTATDHCNNYSTEVCHQIITVLDTTAPSLGLSGPLVIPCPGGSVDSVLAAWGEENSLLDGCETLSEVEFVWEYDSPLDCSDVDPSSSIGLTLSDGCGNTSQYEAQLVPVGGFACGQSWTFDGHDYATVEIGDQCWFAENLRTTTYSNGDLIPSSLTDGDWLSTTSGATAVYGEGSSACFNNSPDIDACDEAQSLEEYGRLYNWYAVDDARSLCPAGWHVPTDGEFTELEDHITSQGFSGTEGTALKSTGGWNEQWGGFNGTDDFGFSALPGGGRGYILYGEFDLAGADGYWWSSSAAGDAVWYRGLYNFDAGIFRGGGNPQVGLSVRCLRDAEIPEVQGCTDPAYIEYDSTATADDGSCFTLASTCIEVEMDGHIYGVVQIGDQCWFAENLRTAVYANGDVIPAGLSDGEWTSTTAGATAVYGEGSSTCNDYSPDIDACDEAQSLEEYGRLYNWYAVDDARSLCPAGWHVPTDGEWTELEDYITSQGFDGTEGMALKSMGGWSVNGNGTDDFGFSALPGGFRFSNNGYFDNAGSDGYWWSSSPHGGNAWFRHLNYDLPVIFRGHGYSWVGVSVRCLRDAE